MSEAEKIAESVRDRIAEEVERFEVCTRWYEGLKAEVRQPSAIEVAHMIRHMDVRAILKDRQP